MVTETTNRTLEQLQAARDTALSQNRRWNISTIDLRLMIQSWDKHLSGADLSGANLSDAYLSDADLSDADLSGAYLSGAYLSGANLSGANLSGADLSDAYLSDADLSCANLSGASLSGAYLPRADLSGADLSGADLSGADLSGANLYGANLSGANLSGAIGLYTTYAPHLSSRGAALLGGVVVENAKVELRFWAGCKASITAAALLKYVAVTHESNPLHQEQYKAAIRFIQACFKSDMAAGKWEYLIDWQPFKKKGE